MENKSVVRERSTVLACCVTAACLSLVFLLGSCTKPYKAERLYWQANKIRSQILANLAEAKAEDYEKAIDMLAQIVEEYPKTREAALAQYNIGELYSLQERYEQAERELEKVLINYPGNVDVCVDAQFLIGAISETQGKWEEAVKEYRKIAENYPRIYRGQLVKRTFDIPLYIAAYYQRRGMTEDAERAYNDAIATYREDVTDNPPDSETFELGVVAQNYIVTVYLAQGKWKEAIEALQVIVDTYPRSRQVPSALYRIGVIYQERLKEPQTAIGKFRQFIDKYPEDELAKEAYIRIAQVLVSQGDVNEAEKDLRKVLEFPKPGTQGAQAMLMIGGLLEQQGKWNEALVEYNRLKEEFPFSEQTLGILVHIAEYYQREKDEEKAKEAYEQALDHYRETIRKYSDNELGALAQQLIARVYEGQNEWEKAVEALRTLVKEFSRSRLTPAALYRIGRMEEEKLDAPGKALGTYKEFRETYPRHSSIPEVRMRIGQIQLAQNDFTAAQETFSGMLTDYAEQPELAANARFMLGVVKEKQGDWEKALAEFERVREEYPKTSQALRTPLYIAQYYKNNEQSDKATNAYQEALRYYREVIEKNPGTNLALAAWEMIVSTRGIQEDWTKAVQSLDQMINAFPDNPRVPFALFRKASIYQEQLKDQEKAIAIYERIIESYPENVMASEAKKQIEKMESSQ